MVGGSAKDEKMKDEKMEIIKDNETEMEHVAKVETGKVKGKKTKNEKTKDEKIGEVSKQISKANKKKSRKRDFEQTKKHAMIKNRSKGNNTEGDADVEE